MAAFSGLRRSEIQGQRWSDYNGSVIQVQRSIWEGITDDTKTDASNGAVPIISALARRFDKYHARLKVQPVKSGPDDPIFAASNGEADHEYRRDESLPAWRGGHAFRRGLATNLHDLGIDDHTIKAILRHSSLTVTQRSYIKSLPKQSVAAMNTFDNSVTALVHGGDTDLGKDGNHLLN